MLAFCCSMVTTKERKYLQSCKALIEKGQDLALSWNSNWVIKRVSWKESNHILSSLRTVTTDLNSCNKKRIDTLLKRHQLLQHQSKSHQSQPLKHQSKPHPNASLSNLALTQRTLKLMLHWLLPVWTLRKYVLLTQNNYTCQWKYFWTSVLCSLPNWYHQSNL